MGYLTRFKVNACMRRPILLPNAALNAKISQQDVDDFYHRFRSPIICSIWITRLLLLQTLIASAGMIAGIVLSSKGTLTIGFFLAFLGYKIVIILLMGCNRRWRQDKVQEFLETENANHWRGRGATWVAERVNYFRLYVFLDSNQP